MQRTTMGQSNWRSALVSSSLSVAMACSAEAGSGNDGADDPVPGGGAAEGTDDDAAPGSDGDGPADDGGASDGAAGSDTSDGADGADTSDGADTTDAGMADTGDPSGLPDLVFETTFDCLDWDQSMGSGDSEVCGTDDGIAGHGGWTTSNGSNDQITADANYSGGAGGKGFRHFRGDGTNNNGGGLRISLPAPVTEMWVRVYMKYSAGFSWTFAPESHPHYTKDFYWNVNGGGNVLIFGYQGGGWGLNNNGNHPSSLDWFASQGDSYTGDGQFHSYEYHVKQDGPDGVIEVWVDGIQYLDKTGVDLGDVPWSYFGLGENQSEVIGAGATDYYTDYDDLAISTTGRIGP